MKPAIGLPHVDHRERADRVPDRGVPSRTRRNYYQYKTQEELTAWNNLFLPITQGVVGRAARGGGPGSGRRSRRTC